MKLILVTILFFFLNGCSLFSPRTSEPPTGNPDIFLQPDEIGQVIPILANSLLKADANALGALLETDFKFYADPLDSVVTKATFRFWDKTSEIIYLRKLFLSPPLTVSTENSTGFKSSDTASLYWNYIVTLPANRTLSGKAIIEIKYNGSKWLIVNWTDLINNGNETIGLWHLENIFTK